MQTVYLGLGTNIGDRKRNLRAAIKAMAPGARVEAESRVYETPAWGYKDQPDFLNMVVKAETGLQPDDLLAYLKRIERRLGRIATFRWGPRLIDIDILFYGDGVWNSSGLIIPHPRLHERAFVLVPMMDIAPDLVHPVLGQTIRQLVGGIDASGVRPA